MKIIAQTDQRSSDDSGIDDISPMDASNRMTSSDGVDKDSFSDFINGDDPKDKADSTFLVGNLQVKNSIFDDLLNERKLELFNDPEVMSLLSSVMQQSKKHIAEWILMKIVYFLLELYMMNLDYETYNKWVFEPCIA